MSERYRGPYSPGAGTASQSQRRTQNRHRYESRTKWITVAALPFLVSAFWQTPLGMVACLAGFGLVAFGSSLTREGLRAQAEYDARRVARRPGWPRKLFGGVLTGLGLGIGAAQPDFLGGAIVIAMAGAFLHYLAFGPDPMRDKGMEGIDSFQQDRVARIIAEGEAYLEGMQDAIRRTSDRRLEARVTLFAETARDLFRRVEEDPGDLAAARRYLGVYLMGARDATVKFVDLYAQTRDADARAQYEALLTDLEENFAARTRSLIENGRTDFDIESQVLRERLAREGVRVPDPAEAAPDSIEDRRGVDLADLFRMPSRTGRKQD